MMGEGCEALFRQRQRQQPRQRGILQYAAGEAHTVHTQFAGRTARHACQRPRKAEVKTRRSFCGVHSLRLRLRNVGKQTCAVQFQ